MQRLNDYHGRRIARAQERGDAIAKDLSARAKACADPATLRGMAAECDRARRAEVSAANRHSNFTRYGSHTYDQASHCADVYAAYAAAIRKKADRIVAAMAEAAP